MSRFLSILSSSLLFIGGCDPFAVLMCSCCCCCSLFACVFNQFLFFGFVGGVAADIDPGRPCPRPHVHACLLLFVSPFPFVSFTLFPLVHHCKSHTLTPVGEQRDRVSPPLFLSSPSLPPLTHTLRLSPPSPPRSALYFNHPLMPENIPRALSIPSSTADSAFLAEAFKSAFACFALSAMRFASLSALSAASRAFFFCSSNCAFALSEAA